MRLILFLVLVLTLAFALPLVAAELPQTDEGHEALVLRHDSRTGDLTKANNGSVNFAVTGDPVDANDAPRAVLGDPTDTLDGPYTISIALVRDWTVILRALLARP